MKTRIQRISILAALLAGGLMSVIPAQATNYAGNGNTGFGGPVGTGSLSVTDNGTNITFTITLTGGSFSGNGLALYIDTGSGGFTSTSGFLDDGDGGRTIVSGYSGSGQSVMTFASGFKPAYALSFSDSYTSLFGLANGDSGSLDYITGQSTPLYTLTVPAADLGLTPGVTANIRIFGSLVSQTGYRSTEAVAGNDSGTQGWNPFTQTAFANYVFDPTVVTTNYVTFQVDMTEQLALGNFVPANGDTVYVAGTFESPTWSPFGLTNNPTAANPNIYSGTAPDTDTAGTVEQYKYGYVSVSNSSNELENIATIVNRSFTLQAGSTVLEPAYYSDVPATPSATTNTVVFQINLAPQIYLGNFTNGDQIEVFGSFQNPVWTAPGIILTNNPTSAQSNIYSGSFTDGNYPGTQYQYKYVIVAGTTDNYETTANRNLVTPTNYAVLPVAYFNNASNVYATPVTFQVDMTAPLADGAFVPANGDTVTAAGTFQSSLSGNQWVAGTFVLTNSPANTNLYIGTFTDPNPPGTGEQYKFQINPAGVAANAVWESIQNRYFALASTAQVLPVVFWNNTDPNNVLLVPTTVTFTVNMANVVDIYGVPFNPANDAVIINGYFTTPAWYSWTDPLLGSFDYTEYVLQNNPVGSSLYTGTYDFPAGSPLETIYKYGIVHNVNSDNNTNADNEASPNLNHTRWIRAVGAYTFPVDIFGMQQTNLPVATEPPFGNLAIAAPVHGQFALTWLGRPGVYLQYSTNLLSPDWVQVESTSGTNSFVWPQTNQQEFFRLINP